MERRANKRSGKCTCKPRHGPEYGADLHLSLPEWNAASAGGNQQSLFEVRAFDPLPESENRSQLDLRKRITVKFTMPNEIATWCLRGAATVVFAALLSALLIAVLYPLLKRYALAKPNARSSHHTPTPQGGGIAVIAAVAATVGLALGFRLFDVSIDTPLPAIVAAAVFMACIGATDDFRPFPVGPRLLLQAIVVAGVIYWLPDDLRVVALLPWWLERLLLVLGGLWYVNLVNFMDGLDWMTVAEVLPLTASLVVFGIAHALPPYGTVVALALGGAVLGFAWFNRPVARLFLGDVGSLPIGLLLGWLLLLVAAGGHLVAAIVMPLYYLADASITLLRRLIRGETIWQAHRTHFYQRATDGGFSVTEVVGRVFVVNLGLCALAVLTVAAPGRPSDAVALLGGGALVTWLLVAFARGKR
jgi:UDP-N-acetylmuramyl pentapeptide phosphotransferase/UDP-N-acetylglucosamine-1-phosphate transferase